MTKTELINEMSEKANVSKVDAGRVLDAALNAVMDAVKGGDKVILTGFGTFMAVERKAREGRNPRTGETIKIPAIRVPKFVPGKAFKQEVK